MQTPTSPPAIFAAGDSVVFRQSAVTTALGVVSPAEGWSLAWLVRKTDGSDDANGTVTADGSEWTVRLTASVTSALAAGAYRWVLRASKAADTLTLAHGTCTVTPDLSDVGVDVRTWEERTLAVVEAALAGTIEGEAKMYTIAGRQVATFTPDELMRLRVNLQAAIAMQRTGAGAGKVSAQWRPLWVG